MFDLETVWCCEMVAPSEIQTLRYIITSTSGFFSHHKIDTIIRSFLKTSFENENSNSHSCCQDGLNFDLFFTYTRLGTFQNIQVKRSKLFKKKKIQKLRMFRVSIQFWIGLSYCWICLALIWHRLALFYNANIINRNFW